MLQNFRNSIVGKIMTGYIVIIILAFGATTATILAAAGASTEALWNQSGALSLAACDPHELAAATEALVQNEKRRAELRERSHELYAGRFDVRHVVSRLRDANADTGHTAT